MKKLIPLLLALLMLVGCSSNAVTTISNKDEVLFSIEDTNITQGEIYNMLRFQNISGSIVGHAQQLFITSQVELTDELKGKAIENLENAKEQFGDYFTAYYGEMEEDEYLEKIFYPAAQQEKFMSDYYDEHADEIISKAEPVKVNILYYDNEETANEVAKKLAEKVSIKDIIEEFGQNNQVGTNREEPLVIDANKLPEIVKEFVQSDEGKAKSFSKTPLKDASGKAFYLVQLIEDDVDTLKDEYRKAFLSDSATTSGLLKDLFKQAKFEVYDQAIYNSIKAAQEDTDFHPDN